MEITSYSISNERYNIITNKVCVFTTPIHHTLNFTVDSEDTVTEAELYFVDRFGNLYLIPSQLIDSSQMVFTTDLKETTYTKIYIVLRTVHGEVKQFLDIPIIEIQSNAKNFIVYKPVTISKESNLFYSKASAYVPKWSKAYKEHGSNFSKIVEPYFKLLQGFYNTVDYNLTSEYQYNTYDYVDDTFKLYSQDGTQLLEQCSLLTGNRKQCSLVSSNSELKLETIYLDSTDTLSDYVLSTPCTLYFKKFDTSAAAVMVEGLDETDTFVTEVVNLISTSVSSTKRKYKVIKTLVHAVPLQLSNYVDCFEQHFILHDNPTPIPLLINKDNYSIFYPTIKLETIGNSPSIGIYNKLDCVYRYYFRSNKIKGVFIDKYLNVYWIENNKLYMNCLSVDLSAYSNNSYENANDFIDYDYDCINDWIDITIDFSKLNEKTTMVCLSDNGIDYYLNTDTKQPQLEKYIIENSDTLGIFSFQILPESFPANVSLITPTKTYPICIAPLILEPQKSTEISVDPTINKLVWIDDSLVMLKTPVTTEISSLTDEVVLMFQWKDCSTLNFNINIEDYEIDNYTMPFLENYITRLNSPTNSSTLIYKINVDKLLSNLFNKTNLEFSIGATKEDNTFLGETPTCTLTIFINGGVNTYQLTINTDANPQYKFSIDTNMILNEI